MMITISNVYKSYLLDKKTKQEEAVLKGVCLDVNKGEMCALYGPSGCGKSTLLNILTGLDRTYQGTVTIAGQNLSELNDKQLTLFRKEYIGFVFQTFQSLRHE